MSGWRKKLKQPVTRQQGIALVVVASTIAVLAAVLANIVNNLPATLVLVPLVASSGPAAVLAVYGLVAAELWWLLRRAGSFGVVPALVFPLPLAVFLGVSARAVVLTVAGRPLRWRGRLVPTRSQSGRGTKSRSR